MKDELILNKSDQQNKANKILRMVTTFLSWAVSFNGACHSAGWDR